MSKQNETLQTNIFTMIMIAIVIIALMFIWGDCIQ
jgi:hypothetical protein